MQEQHIEITVSGRYLIEIPAGDGPFRILAGFHGYGQTAEEEMELLRRVPGSDCWLRCSIEALHPFLNKRGDPGACWMTRRERDLRIAENVRYVDAVLDRVKQDYPMSGPLVLHGFSQGVAMACRAAMLGKHTVSGVMLLGGDIHPEFDGLRRMGRVHLGCGDHDRFYPREKFEADAARLRESGVPVETIAYHGSHGPSADYLVSAGRFLQAIG
ncbi:MAG: phospholipase [Chlorobiaceae bacterium]|nr:phospholipase [Chlorobiaceae bacterium]